MELLSALSHAIELFIVFQFFNDLFANKGRKTVAAAVGIAFYAVAYAAFLLFNSTVVNILLCFVIDSVFAKLFFECNIKGATLGALSGIFAPRARKKLISRTPRYKAAENFDGIPGYLTINSICISLHFRLYYVNMSYIKQS